MSMVHAAMARRSTSEGVRASAEKEEPVSFTGELERYEDDWLESVKDAIAGLKELDQEHAIRARAEAAARGPQDAHLQASALQTHPQAARTNGDNGRTGARREEHLKNWSDPSKPSAFAHRLRMALRTFIEHLRHR
jgi:hypothetical protein